MAEKEIVFMLEKVYDKGNPICFTAIPRERALTPHSRLQDLMEGRERGGSGIKSSTKSPVPMPALTRYVVQDNENLKSELDSTLDFRLGM